MRAVPFRLLILVAGCALAFPGGSAAGEVPADEIAEEAGRVSWWSGPGTRAWTTSFDREQGVAAVPLMAPRWFKPAPEIDLETFDGPSRSTGEYAGRVLVLDFWATWCEPCRAQLPLMVELRDRLGPEAMEVLAVNMAEPDDVVVPYVESLTLTLPVVRYSEAIQQSFRVRTLPTTIVIDRWSRIRARFNGYRTDIEEEIGRIVQDLVEEEVRPATLVADVLSGEGLFAVRWSRDLGADVSALAAVEPTAGRRGVLAVAGRDLFVLAEDGRTFERHGNARGVSSLLSADLDGDGLPEAIGYRLGSARMATLDIVDGQHEVWEAAEPVLGAAAVPARSAELPGYLLLDTPGGLRKVDVSGKPVGVSREQAPGTHGIRGLVVADWDGAFGPVLLEPGVALHRVGPAGETKASEPVEGTVQAIVAAGQGGEGVGLVSVPVTASATGHWLAGEEAQLALAFADRLIVLDLDSGTVRFHARWPGISDVRTTDLDSNGRPELAVASGRRTTLLGAAAGTR